MTASHCSCVTVYAANSKSCLISTCLLFFVSFSQPIQNVPFVTFTNFMAAIKGSSLSLPPCAASNSGSTGASSVHATTGSERVQRNMNRSYQITDLNGAGAIGAGDQPIQRHLGFHSFAAARKASRDAAVIAAANHSFRRSRSVLCRMVC
jgi:hypothetical protein